MRRAAPIPEIAGSDAFRVLMVSQRRERDRPETAEVLLRRVPVEVLGSRPVLVDVAKVEEEVRLPAAATMNGRPAIGAVPLVGTNDVAAGCWPPLPNATVNETG